MKKHLLFTLRRAGAAAMAAVFAFNMMPFSSMAVSGSTVAKDGTYNGTATVANYDYDVEVEISVSGGKISAFTVTNYDELAEDEDNEDNISYLKKAIDGTSKKSGATKLLAGLDASADAVTAALDVSRSDVDVVTKATYSLNAIKKAVVNALSAAEAAESESEKTEESTSAAATVEESTSAAATVEESTSAAATVEESTSAAATVEESTKEAVTVEESTQEASKEESTGDDSESQTPVSFNGYLLMNIPYGEFYAAEGDADVDAMTSATKAKTMTGTLAGGSYHNDANGTDISGVTYPVKVSAEDMETLAGKGYTVITDSDSLVITTTNRGSTSTATYNGKDALFGAGDYAYYVLSSEPSYYKELTVSEDGSMTFGEAEPAATVIEDVESTFTSDSSYGDYQLNIISEDLPFTFGTDTVYAVTVNTEDGDSYGMKHVENIWRGTQLAWSTGHTTNVHGCPLSYENYKDMEGKTITSVTYYTSAGTFELKLAKSAYVIPYADATVTAAFSSATELELSGVPEDAKNAKVTVSYSEDRKTTDVADEAGIVDGKVTLDTPAENGKTYTVKVYTDNYAVMTATAVYEVEETPTEEESTEAPSTEESTEVPSTEESTEVPSTEESTEVPSTEESKVTPSEEESTQAIETAESEESTTEAPAVVETSDNGKNDTTAEAETTASAAKTADTGDSNNMFMWLFLVLMSGAAFVILESFRREENK